MPDTEGTHASHICPFHVLLEVIYEFIVYIVWVSQLIALQPVNGILLNEIANDVGELEYAGTLNET
jgi:hypothetical protein